jgi:hypothetical protein
LQGCRPAQSPMLAAPAIGVDLLTSEQGQLQGGTTDGNSASSVKDKTHPNRFGPPYPPEKEGSLQNRLTLTTLYTSKFVQTRKVWLKAWRHHPPSPLVSCGCIPAGLHMPTVLNCDSTPLLRPPAFHVRQREHFDCSCRSLWARHQAFSQAIV